MSQSVYNVKFSSPEGHWRITDEHGEALGKFETKAEAALMAKQKAATRESAGESVHVTVYNEDGTVDASLDYGV